MLKVAQSQLMYSDMPIEVQECIQIFSNKTGDVMMYDTTDATFVACLKQIMLKNRGLEGLNITVDDVQFMDNLIDSLFQPGRQKRDAKKGGMGRAGGVPMPPTGFRVRQEIRRLSDGQRAAFFNVLNRMKKNGEYDRFAQFHKGIVLRTAHSGPAFLSWHRIFIAMFEEALRRYNPKLALPYWDPTLDYYMKNPIFSVIWSSAFLGNGNGHVRTGPFAGWRTPSGPLTRNIGVDSTLINRNMIDAVMSRCRVRDISFPFASPKYNFELFHGGPHCWVGGHFAGMNTAGHDPLFWLYHAYIDYVWELFRMRQMSKCGVNPAVDIPVVKGPQSPKSPMARFPQFTNADGFSGAWTRFWYRYEPSPTCSRFRPFCGSPYLRCDIVRQLCVSVPAKYGPKELPPGSEASVRRARIESSRIFVGRLFPAPPPEPRTQAYRFGDGKALRGARRIGGIGGGKKGPY